MGRRTRRRTSCTLSVKCSLSAIKTGAIALHVADRHEAVAPLPFDHV